VNVHQQHQAKRVLALLLPLWGMLLIASIATAKHKEAFIACMFVAYGLHLIVKVLVALEATRRWSEDRRSGALELLLATPLPVSWILCGQRDALKQQFMGASVALFLVIVSWIGLGLIVDAISSRVARNKLEMRFRREAASSPT
jgi:ABC-type transport system involved in cytochrome c biogenesis permease component